MADIVSQPNGSVELRKFDSFLACWSYNTQMHLWRYVFAAKYVKNKIVIDVSAGVGYGSNCISRAGAQHVLGIDLARRPLRFAQGAYKQPNLNFTLGNGLTLPVADDSIEVVTSFETIEHIPIQQQESFVAEISRVLKPGGLFLCSTPNHKYSPGHFDHTREFMPEELFGMMPPYFERVDRYGQYITNDDLGFQQAQTGSFNYQVKLRKDALLRKTRHWLGQTPARIRIKTILKQILRRDNQVTYPEPVYISETVVDALDQMYAPVPVKENDPGILFGLLAICHKGV